VTTKASILQAIRRKCLDCCCGQPGEVRECPVSTCRLWPFRMGMDPEPSPTRGFGKSAVYTGGFEAGDVTRLQGDRGAGRPLVGTGT
jgi:hypothetical protein